MVDRGAYSLDAVALDEDFAGLKDRAVVYLKQARGMQDDGLLGLL